MNKKIAKTLTALLAGALLAACTTVGWNPKEKATASAQGNVDPEVAKTIADFKNKDPGLHEFFRRAYGYAVFPTVGKGGITIGGAYGEGKVYEQGRLIGLTSLTQITVGFQLGGQAYSEIIFFRDKATLADFRKGNFELGAQASAVAVTAGAAASTDYSNGVAIFTLTKGGLMYEASVGGQKFSFTPISER